MNQLNDQLFPSAYANDISKMRRKLDDIRQAAKVALSGEAPRFRSVIDLAQKAGVDAPGLKKFLDAGTGESAKTSFVLVASLLSAIGGKILLPGEEDGSTCQPASAEKMRLMAVAEDTANQLKALTQWLDVEILRDVLPRIFDNAKRRLEA